MGKGKSLPQMTVKLHILIQMKKWNADSVLTVVLLPPFPRHWSFCSEPRVNFHSVLHAQGDVLIPEVKQQGQTNECAAMKPNSS